MSLPLPNRVTDLSWMFAEFGQLADKFDAVNLVIGSPELDPPQFLKDSLIEAVDKAPQQYINPWGYGPLREAIAKHCKPYYSSLGRDLDPDTEILATAGAVAGLYCTLMALVCEGDELISFDPCWPGIINIVKATGGILKSTPIKMTKNAETKTIDWEYDWDALEEALSEKTKVILLINPQSPTGRVFSEDELQKLTQIIDTKAPNCYVVSDDVYDTLKYEEEKEFLSFANYGNNFQRTITCSNFGKRFACTGWKVGWAIGPKHLMKHVELMHETTIWNFNTLGQYAMSKCIAGEADKEYEGFGDYYKYVRHTYTTVNKGLAKLFQECKLPLYPALVEGSMSMTLEISEVEPYIPEKYFTAEYIDDPKISKREFKDGKVPLDFAFCRWMACEVGIAMIPGSSLYIDQDIAKHDFVRISICKKESIIDKVAEKLQNLDALI